MGVFSAYFSCWPEWVISILSVLMFMESFLWHQHSNIEQIHWVYFTYYIFYFYNSICFFFIFSVSLLRLSIIFVFIRVLTTAQWSIFVTALHFLLDNSNTCIMALLALVNRLLSFKLSIMSELFFYLFWTFGALYSETGSYLDLLF